MHLSNVHLAAARFSLVFITALLHSNIQWKRIQSVGSLVLRPVGTSLALSLTAICIANDDSKAVLVAFSWWRCLAALVTKQWPRLFPLPLCIVEGGPLGKGCGKMCDIMVGLALWYCSSQDSLQYLVFGPLPSVKMWLLVAFFALVVNLVLKIWSHATKSKGSHAGVKRMVEGSLGRSLTAREHMDLFGLAVANAFCEEVSSRVLWRSAFALALSDSENQKSTQLYSNLGQAGVFGIWHYYGIPSGWTGVGLTFVYGFLMGWLADLDDNSLWLPLAAHTLADYYIFAIIARKRSCKEKD